MGDAGVVLQSWSCWASPRKDEGFSPPRSACCLGQTYQRVSLPCTLRDTYLNLIKTQVLKKFYPKNMYFACEMKNMLFPRGP